MEPKSITTKIVVHKKICQLHCAVFKIVFKVKNVLTVPGLVYCTEFKYAISFSFLIRSNSFSITFFNFSSFDFGHVTTKLISVVAYLVMHVAHFCK